MAHADRLTPLGIVVLGLLRECDMHPYEMMRLLRQRRDDRLVAITNGTFYHTVSRLQRAGMVDEVGVDRDGNRPERTTYRLTDLGREASEEWVRRELARTDDPPKFRVALAEAHDLPRDEVVALLGQRRESLAAELDVHSTGLEGAMSRDVPLQFLVELERQSALLRADLAWLDSLLARLRDRSIAWGIDEIPVETHRRLIALRKAATP